jgi:hypothetical protein
MAQRRSSPGRGDDRSDLDDVKELAAKARSETGGPVLKPNPGELSGVRPRRDSIVGMRLTPPPRATGGGELPNWLWGVLGCLSVLLVGFAGLFFLGRSGKLGPLLGEAASLVSSGPAAPTPAAPAQVAAPAPAPLAAAQQPEAPAQAEHPAGEHAARSEHEHSHGHAAAASGQGAPAAPPAAEGPPAAPAPAAAAAADNAPVAAADEPSKRGARATKAKAGKASDAPGGNDDSAPAPAAKASADDSDDDSLPGQDDVERALDALAPRVRGCFVKYQIKGTARVRLVATPAGKAESINVTGDFEDTPTGNCVESILSEAKLPTFRGPPLKLSQSYQLR